MSIYWSQENIPALKTLSAEERSQKIRENMPLVYKKWQVWLPIVFSITAGWLFIFFGPEFPGRIPVIFLAGSLVAPLVQLPANHYLQKVLEQKEIAKSAD